MVMGLVESILYLEARGRVRRSGYLLFYVEEISCVLFGDDRVAGGG